MNSGGQYGAGRGWDPDLRQTAFAHLLLSGTLVHEDSFEQLQARCGISVRPQAVWLVSIDRYPDLAADKPAAWRKEIGRMLAEAVRGAVAVPFVCVWTEEGVLAVLPEGPDTGDEAWRRWADQTARQIQRSAEAKGLSVSVGIGARSDEPKMLHRSYEQARAAMVNRFFQGNRLVYHYQPKQTEEKRWSAPLSQAERAELLARVRIGDEAGTAAFLQIALDKMAEAYKRDVDMFKSEVVDLVMAMSRQVLEMGGNAAAILTDNARIIQQLYTTVRYDKFAQSVLAYGRRLAAQIGEAGVPGVSPVIRQAVQYMKRHHHRKLSLREVAQFCCLSVYHFSRLFTREMGVSFTDYLNRLRVEKAVYLLTASDMPIQQVAASVGFPDANYFSRIFKRYTNRTPSEYRSATLCY